VNVLLTGADGYIGRALARRLCAVDAALQGRALRRLTLCDLRLDPAPEDGRVERLVGSIADPAVIEKAVGAAPPDIVFHLAAVPSGQSEADYELGLRVNLHAMVALLEALRRQGRAPTVVYTSSIAVFGAPLPPRIDDDTPLRPTLSYGAHKQMAEIFLADCTRRGFVEARPVRLPGIVARPPAPSGALSAFSSDLIRALMQGGPYTCPVSPQATLWLMSLERCVDNLLHAAQPGLRLPPGATAWTLPALRVRINEVVQALDRLVPGAGGRIRYAPDAALEAQFGHLPPLATPAADAAGFRHDGDLHALLRRASPSSSPAAVA
jgi:nucleoside-diphosphate-sugar epimerase